MSASRGVDPYLRAFSRYSGVFQGWRRTTRVHGVGLPSNCRVTSHDHFRPGVDSADEVVTQVSVDFKGYVHRSGTTGHEEGVREDVAALVGPVMLVLDWVDDD